MPHQPFIGLKPAPRQPLQITDLTAAETRKREGPHARLVQGKTTFPTLSRLDRQVYFYNGFILPEGRLTP